MLQLTEVDGFAFATDDETGLVHALAFENELGFHKYEFDVGITREQADAMIEQIKNPKAADMDAPALLPV